MNLIPKNDFLLDGMFDDFFNYKDNNSFKCDIYDKDGKYYIEMDAPGVSKDDTSIEYDNGYLVVKISKVEEDSDEQKNYIRKERFSKQFSRSFYVGDVDIDKIEANFKNGCLIIKLPKQEMEDTKKIIQIKED